MTRTLLQELNHKADLQIPLMAEGMTHGVLRKWLVRTGDRVAVGEVLYELETDDGIWEVESLDLGTITANAQEGSRYPVGAPVGFIEFSEEERIEHEYFALALTHEMRTAIEQQRGDLSRDGWLQAAFDEFVRQKLKPSEAGDGGA